MHPDTTPPRADAERSFLVNRGGLFSCYGRDDLAVRLAPAHRRGCCCPRGFDQCRVPLCLGHQIVQQPVVQLERLANRGLKFRKGNMERCAAKAVLISGCVLFCVFHCSWASFIRFLFASMPSVITPVKPQDVVVYLFAINLLSHGNPFILFA